MNRYAYVLENMRKRVKLTQTMSFVYIYKWGKGVFSAFDYTLKAVIYVIS